MTVLKNVCKCRYESKVTIYHIWTHLYVILDLAIHLYQCYMYLYSLLYHDA